MPAYQTTNNAYQGRGEFVYQTDQDVVVETPRGGGDSTRLKRRGRRPKYFWQQAIEDEKLDEIAEAMFDAVADAYLIESHREFAEQVNYIKNVEIRLKRANFDDLAEQLQASLKDLAYRAEMRLLLAKAQEESELRELLEII
jgi:predicted ArsR family transcriptional regulator